MEWSVSFGLAQGAVLHGWQVRKSNNGATRRLQHSGASRRISLYQRRTLIV